MPPQHYQSQERNSSSQVITYTKRYSNLPSQLSSAIDSSVQPVPIKNQNSNAAVNENNNREINFANGINQISNKAQDVEQKDKVVVNLRSLKDQNIDAFVHPKSPINEVIQTYCQEDLELPPEERLKIKMPAHLKRLAKNIVPTF